MTACKELLKREFPAIDDEFRIYVESEYLRHRLLLLGYVNYI